MFFMSRLYIYISEILHR
ncbi:unnamed protein product [Staurois parvus]|uniref:Uncharacterized protein n=1 Tax=Staurois parvus TaxID=386267 RepID=A0ABN9G833_9NEOB|nr:unnamed protein product [Staurois parvus]